MILTYTKKTYNTQSIKEITKEKQRNKIKNLELTLQKIKREIRDRIVKTRRPVNFSQRRSETKRSR